MQLAAETTTAYPMIQRYHNSSITIAEQNYRDPIIVYQGDVIDWQVAGIADFNKASLALLLDLAAEVVILGTGQQNHFLSAELAVCFQQQGKGLEVMNTSAACRTYNLLLAEGRPVVAGLIL